MDFTPLASSSSRTSARHALSRGLLGEAEEDMGTLGMEALSFGEQSASAVPRIWDLVSLFDYADLLFWMTRAFGRCRGILPPSSRNRDPNACELKVGEWYRCIPNITKRSCGPNAQQIKMRLNFAANHRDRLPYMILSPARLKVHISLWPGSATMSRSENMHLSFDSADMKQRLRERAGVPHIGGILADASPPGADRITRVALHPEFLAAVERDVLPILTEGDEASAAATREELQLFLSEFLGVISYGLQNRSPEATRVAGRRGNHKLGAAHPMARAFVAPWHFHKQDHTEYITEVSRSAAGAIGSAAGAIGSAASVASSSVPGSASSAALSTSSGFEVEGDQGEHGELAGEELAGEELAGEEAAAGSGTGVEDVALEIAEQTPSLRTDVRSGVSGSLRPPSLRTDARSGVSGGFQQASPSQSEQPAAAPPRSEQASPSQSEVRETVDQLLEREREMHRLRMEGSTEDQEVSAALGRPIRRLTAREVALVSRELWPESIMSRRDLRSVVTQSHDLVKWLVAAADDPDELRKDNETEILELQGLVRQLKTVEPDNKLVELGENARIPPLTGKEMTRRIVMGAGREGSTLIMMQRWFQYLVAQRDPDVSDSGDHGGAWVGGTWVSVADVAIPPPMSRAVSPMAAGLLLGRNIDSRWMFKNRISGTISTVTAAAILRINPGYFAAEDELLSAAYPEAPERRAMRRLLDDGQRVMMQAELWEVGREMLRGTRAGEPLPDLSVIQEKTMPLAMNAVRRWLQSPLARFALYMIAHECLLSTPYAPAAIVDKYEDGGGDFYGDDEPWSEDEEGGSSGMGGSGAGSGGTGGGSAAAAGAGGGSAAAAGDRGEAKGSPLLIGPSARHEVVGFDPIAAYMEILFARAVVTLAMEERVAKLCGMEDPGVSVAHLSQDVHLVHNWLQEIQDVHGSGEMKVTPELLDARAGLFSAMVFAQKILREEWDESFRMRIHSRQAGGKGKRRGRR